MRNRSVPQQIVRSFAMRVNAPALVVFASAIGSGIDLRTEGFAQMSVAFGALTREARGRELVEDARAVVVGPDHCAQLEAISRTYLRLALQAFLEDRRSPDAVGFRFAAGLVVRIALTLRIARRLT